MGRHKLKATQLATKKPGLLGDGDGLYLRTTLTAAGNFGRSWIFIYRFQGRRREMGLGAYGSGTAAISLPRARERAQEARDLLAAGIDPQQAKRRAQGSQTFGQVVDDFLESKRAGWSNANHIRQWERTLEEICAPLHQLAIDKVVTEDVLSILRPIWTETPEHARRVRMRIELVLDFARAKELRSGDNPARGRGHIHNLLSAHDRAVQHMRALPYGDLPTFWKTLAGVSGVGAAALRFTILTAARPGEARGAPWGEIDFAEALWTIPAERMKQKRLHRVPLSSAAISVLQSVQPDPMASKDYVFPGQKKGRPLSDMSLTAVLRRLEVKVDVHGFRSTFRDWVAETTDYPGEVAEAALSHAIGDATEKAYRRGDALAKRRALMDDWARYCTGE